MAAKLLHSLADDNPDLQKQIGCMTGIFQIFDRQHVLAGRRLSHKRLPPGDSHFHNGNSEKESFNVYQRQTAAEVNSNKNLNEKQRLSTESSRPSFSSSCSSLSSLDCNKAAQPETSSCDRVVFPETPSRDPVITQPSTSPRLGWQSLDLRDVVKHSMYRENRGLLVKTTNNEESTGHPLKHKDSPRPVQLSKSADGSYVVGNKGKQNVPADLKESLRVLAKLRDAPWYYDETKECPRSSYEGKDLSWHTISKDAPRFSYDGREINCLSFESRDTIKSTPKLKELPRLSLDSREISMRGSSSDLRSNYLQKDLEISGSFDDNVYNLQRQLGTQKRPPNVVAKLMGLETLPDSASTCYTQKGSYETALIERSDSFSRSFRTNDLSRPTRVPKSPRSSVKEPISPRWKNPDLVMKSISKLPIELAPWKQSDGSRAAQKQAFRPAKVPPKAQNSIPSVYSEIEKRLKDLEFKQSGKDLRALKQILEAMQTKGLLETRKEEQGSNFGTQCDYEPKGTMSNQKPRSVGQQNQKNNHVSAFAARSSDSLRTYESPIVIMKPAKLVQKSGLPASSVIPIESPSGLPKILSHGHTESRKESINSRMAKDQSPRNSRKDSAIISSDKKNSLRYIKSTQTSTGHQQLLKESQTSTTSSVKSSGSVSPRLQQKKLELEKRSRPPTPPSDSNRTRRQSNRQPTESVSPGGRQRFRASKLQQSDDQLSQISNESRTSSHQGDDISLQSDSTVIYDLKMDVEVTSAERSNGVNGGQGLSIESGILVSGSVQKELTSTLEEDGTFSELVVVAPEHPSPVSVLDASMYRDDSLSPVKQIPNAIEGDGVLDSSHRQSEVNDFLSNTVASGLTSVINRKKLQNVENLVKKLKRLNSTHDEASTDYIASLCENTDPDHRYISEILLASGLLLRDLGSGLTTFQLHPSGHPINPELFLVLEQTKASTLNSKDGRNPGKTSYTKPSPEKLHRKLIFDAVNEILVKKLAVTGPNPEPWSKSGKPAKKALSAQKLLKELCSEIEQLQVKKPECSLEDEDDGLKTILWEDVMCRSESWTDFHAEVPGLVLDVERLVFKDLVDEIVISKAGGLRTKPGRRRQLFAK